MGYCWIWGYLRRNSKRHRADSVFVWMGRSTCAWIRVKGIQLRNGLLPSSEAHLEEVIKNYGEERFAKQIARAIVAARARQPIVTTHQLAAIVATAVRSRERENKQNPATRTFQAIRIYLNQELEKLSLALPQCVEVLNAGRAARGYQLSLPGRPDSEAFYA